MRMNNVNGLNGLSIQNSYLANKTLLNKTNVLKNYNNTNKQLDNKQTRTSLLVNNNYLNFSGNAKRINNACIITGEEKDLPLLVTKKNDSYVVEFDSQTEIIYGIDAVKYLNKLDEFEYDTQIIFPKKAQGEIILDDGSTIAAKENNAILINKGTKAKVKTIKGYPFVIVSKKDFDWYERHSNNAKDKNIKNKFLELMYYNSHLYNGEFAPDIMLDKEFLDEKFLKGIEIDKWKSRNKLIDEIYSKKDLLSEEQQEEISKIKQLYDKLCASDLIEQKQDGYLKFKLMPKFDFLSKTLQKEGFNEEEVRILKPIIEQARRVSIETKVACRNSIEDFDKSLVKRLKETGIFHNNKTDADKYVYWRRYFGNKTDIKEELQAKGFNEEEQESIIASWKKANLTGFDATGLKFINEDIAIYNLDDKLNNWTQSETNWVSNSTALVSSKGKSTFIGTSLVQTDENKIIPMGELREEEKLHAHPNRKEKRQTEVYLITSGAAALNVVKNGKSGVKVLKQGDLAVVGPGVQHCVNTILGEYEHIVVQIPSAFQYGFSFKSVVEPPQDYDEEKLKQEAHYALENLAL